MCMFVRDVVSTIGSFCATYYHIAKQVAPASSFESPNPAKCAWWCSHRHISQTSTHSPHSPHMPHLDCRRRQRTATQTSLCSLAFVLAQIFQYFNHKACATKTQTQQTRQDSRRNWRMGQGFATSRLDSSVKIQIPRTFQEARSAPRAWPYPSIPLRQPTQRFGHNHPVFD